MSLAIVILHISLPLQAITPAPAIFHPPSLLYGAMVAIIGFEGKPESLLVNEMWIFYIRGSDKMRTIGLYLLVALAIAVSTAGVASANEWKTLCVEIKMGPSHKPAPI